MDLAVAAGNRLMIVWGRDRRLSLDHRKQAEVEKAAINIRSFSSAIRSVAAGDFTGNRVMDVGLLFVDHSVRILSNARPGERLLRVIARWKEEILARENRSETGRLVPVRVSSVPVDNLLVTDASTKSIEILTVDVGMMSQASKGSGREPGGHILSASLDLEGEAIAVLPMRLDLDALTDLVILRNVVDSHTVVVTGQRAISGGAEVTTQDTTFANTAPIKINDNTATTPYPSTIDVSGVAGTIGRITVRLNNLSHTVPSDVDVLLAGPTGQKTVLMSDCGGEIPVSNVTLTLDDTAASFVDAGLVSGTFKPTDLSNGVDSFSFPAPAPPYAASLSAFNGTTPNGTWRLYVADDFGNNSEGILGGWELTIEPVISVTNVNDSGAGSLRHAIQLANSKRGTDTIRFSIPGSGRKTIFLGSVLPVVTEAVTIDGTSQPGFSGSPLIALRIGDKGSVLKITGGNSTVRGLDICSVTSGLKGIGINHDIEVTTAGGNRIEGNVISEAGISVSSSHNTIGGTATNASNGFATNDRSFGLSLGGFRQPGARQRLCSAFTQLCAPGRLSWCRRHCYHYRWI